MFQTILTALGVYISTSIDYLFILLIMFTQIKKRSQKSQIYAGQFLGTGILVALGLVATYVISFIPEDWIIGLLGLIPIMIGIHFLMNSNENEDKDEILKKINDRQSSELFLTMALLTVASGGDNLGIYIPFFSTLAWTDIILVLLIFAIGIVGLIEISYALSSVPTISGILKKYERIMIPLVFTALGTYIMLENRTIQTIFTFIF